MEALKTYKVESAFTNWVHDVAREASLEFDDEQDVGEAGHVVEVGYLEERWCTLGLPYKQVSS